MCDNLLGICVPPPHDMRNLVRKFGQVSDVLQESARKNNRKSFPPLRGRVKVARSDPKCKVGVGRKSIQEDGFHSKQLLNSVLALRFGINISKPSDSLCKSRSQPIPGRRRKVHGEIIVIIPSLDYSIKRTFYNKLSEKAARFTSSH